ncbi:hypothetical protein [Flavobacterium pedocola]
MKRVFLLAAFAVLGFAVVSCSSDDNEIVNPSKRNLEKENNFMRLSSQGGIIPSVNIVQRDTVNGPGDDPIIVPPPPTKP